MSDTNITGHNEALPASGTAGAPPAVPAQPPSSTHAQQTDYATMRTPSVADTQPRTTRTTQATAAPVAPIGASSAGYATPTQVGQPKKSRWWIPLIIILALLALIGFMFNSCMSSLDKLSGSSFNDFGDNTIAVINIDGTIQYDGTANSPEGLKSLLDTAADDDNVKAVVLRVNSGGGVAAAGEEMSTYLADFDKPVVVSSAAINASAAYMISAQADYIYVLNSTDIGSIGTIMQHYDLSELLAKLGINIENIKSADSKDSSYYNRPLTEEERAEYQHQVDVINNNFIRMVAEGRNMTEDEVRALADGSTKVGQESVDAKLADGVGTFEDACKKAAELAGLDEYEVEDLALYDSDFSNLVGLLSTGDDGAEMRLLKALQEIEEHDGLVR